MTKVVTLSAGELVEVDIVTGGSPAASIVEVDFGSVPVWSATFTIVDAGVGVSSQVSAWQDSTPASGREGNDAEFDALVCATMAGVGQFDLTVSAVPGPVVGARNIAYLICT
jgi:hypothetical protein